VASPIPVWWDRTLYANRNERIAFTVEVHNALVLKTEEFAPDAVIELDVPPSPEKVFLTAKTSGGTVERSDLRVHERVLPGWESSAFVLDTFGSLKATSLGGKRGVIEEGGSISLALGSRVGAAQRTGFVVMEYRISKASLRLGKKPARAGIELEVPVAAPLRDFQSLVLWARGDPVRGPASPVYIQVTGSAGTTRTFEIRRLKEDWKAFSFKLHGIPGKGQSIRRVAVFVEAREVLPPNGTIMLGGLYLVPTPVTYPEPVNADQEQEGKAEAR
jgi:hypothetical protein